MHKIFLVALGAMFASTAYAAPYRMALESNADAAGGAEVYGVTFNSWDDIISWSTSSQGFSALNIAPAFSIVGLTYDGAYRMVLESNADAAGGAEIYGVTFDTWDDFLTWNTSSQGFSALNIAPAFSVVGMAYDGDYRMVLESNADAAGGAEVYGVTFDTWDDFLTWNTSSQGFSALNIAPAFGIAGLEFDGGYRMLLESNADAAGGAEVYGVTFDTWDDFLTWDVSSQGFSALNIAPAFGIADYAFEFEPTSEVPEPAIQGILGLGLAGLGAMRPKRRTTSPR